MKKNKSILGNLTVSSNYPVIVYGSVRDLVSEHRSIDAALKSLERDQLGCRSQGGYSDASIYEWSDAGWTVADYAMA